MRFTASHERLREVLLAWYGAHHRDLPWRRTADPYAIFVSEVMLQQTQVDRVIPKYEAFLLAFPTVEALASSSLADVLRLWSGLGYNRRARFLREAAIHIARDGWPTTEEGMRQLPGVGPYTAGAILSFAFGKRSLAFDVNVQRVLRRAFVGVGPSRVSKNDVELRRLAEKILPEDASTWQQALMDMGAIFCRATPRCASCPLRDVCQSSRAFIAGYKEPRVKKVVVRFEDSARFVRGQIMKHLSREAASSRVLCSALAAYDVVPDRVHAALHNLVREGMVVEEKRIYRLPDA